MRANWVIESKFDRPRIHPRQIEKSSIVARLQASNADAILVYAPAGFGKSTLLTHGRAPLTRLARMWLGSISTKRIATLTSSLLTSWRRFGARSTVRAVAHMTILARPWRRLASFWL
jgi:ATP/maltotriose-dependent transcriptional regulator MalT